MAKRALALNTFDTSFNLRNISPFFSCIVPGYIKHSTTYLTIDPNMLSLAYVKHTVDGYKELFGVILGKASINSRSIQMMGLLPTLFGSLRAVPRNLE